MAKKKRSSKSAFAAAAVAGKESPSGTHNQETALYQSRKDAIRSSHEVQNKILLRVDPERCRLWEHHNRFQDGLNEDKLKDLIDSLIAEGKQTTPAIVRRLTGEDKEFEIIAGAQRFWAVNYLRNNNYPDFKYFIEVQDLTDEQAFRASDIENRVKNDLSDYERAVDYQRALGAYYSSQSDMAKRLGLTESDLSRYLTLSKVPLQIAEAYADLDQLRVSHAPKILKAMSDASAKKRILKKVTELKLIHAEKSEKGDKPITGAQVLSALLKASKESSGPSKPSSVRAYGPPKKPHLELKSVNRHALQFQVSRATGASLEDVVESFREALTEYYKN